ISDKTTRAPHSSPSSSVVSAQSKWSVSLESHCRRMTERAKAASEAMVYSSTAQKNEWLIASSNALQSRSAEVLETNACDVAGAPGLGLNDAAIHRLKLTPARIAAAADELRQFATLPDPVGEVRETATRPNGLVVRKVGVPIGVVFFIYESRPNVTVDAAAL